MNGYANRNAFNLIEYHAIIKNMVTKTMWHKGNVKDILITMYNWSFCCGTKGSAAFLQCEDTGSIPDLEQWIKDLALPQLQCSSQMWFRSGAAAPVV